MGTTMTFYLIENRDLTLETLKKRMGEFRVEARKRNREQEERFGAILSSFLDMDRFEEVKDEMRRESPELFGFVSQLVREKEEQSREKIIPFPGSVPSESPRWVSAIGQQPEPIPKQKGPVLAYRSDARWLPFYEEEFCEGYYATSLSADILAKDFGAPVLAFSIFDSDILFVSYSDPERDVCEDYAKPNFEGFEEYDMDRYREEFPTFLCAYGDEATLREVWEGEEVFADDRMAKLCEAIGAQVLYSSQELPRGFQWVE